MDKPPKVLAAEIASALNEPNKGLIRKIILVAGADLARALCQDALEIEASEGMMTADGSRRRTPGGVFFHLARVRLSEEDRLKIWPWLVKHPTERPSQPVQPPLPPALPLRWEDRMPYVQEALTQKGEAFTVKLTLIGRPGKIVEQGQCVVTTMKSAGKVPSLPKGVPVPPANAMTYVVFIAAKQWRKIAEFIKNPEDVLIVEGYPTYDPELKKMALYALNTTTKLAQQAQRQSQKAKQHEQQFTPE